LIVLLVVFNQASILLWLVNLPLRSIKIYFYFELVFAASSISSYIDYINKY